MGYDIGLNKVYFKPTMQEVLEGNDRMRGYVSVINDLTVNDENRLRKQVAEQEHIRYLSLRIVKWYHDLEIVEL